MPDIPDIVRLLQSMAFQAGRTRRSPNADAVHDLRVSIRRFSQALAVFKDCLPRRALKKVRRTLKETLVFAGEVRNCDVALEYLEKICTPAAEKFRGAIRNRRKEKESVLVEELERWVRRKLSAKWRSAVAQADLRIDGNPVAHYAGEFYEAGDKAATEKSSAKQLHALRLAAKKFRYTLELFAPSSDAANEWLERIGRVQARLGRINDCRTVRSMVSRLGGDSEIEAELKRKQRRRMRDFRKLWRDEFSGKAPVFPEKKPAGRSTGTSAHAMRA
jgi:CHAD domain-containing protein